VAASFGAVVFADIGQVSSTLKLLPSVLRTGVGVGLRYYTPIGPLRLDVGLPTHRSAGTDAFQVYIGLGQAF
jgi:translocation and assembly module TamA